MTQENIIRLHTHFSKLSEGDFTARDFDTETAAKNQGDEDGNMRMGKLSGERIALIKSDALVAKLEMEEKYPFLTDETTEEDTDFSSKTKAQLTDIATEKGLDITEAKTKDDLIVILEASEEV